MYKVDNAIIMAAGLSSRFAPLSYDKPKGLIEVKGEVLIERQIKQLKEAGINDITIVVGYLKEQFFYLKDKFGVDIIVNDEYNKRNNNSTLYKVKNKLKNTYICSSDNYFVKNVFKNKVKNSSYSAVYEYKKTNEYYMDIDDNGKILNVTPGGENGWIMLGYAFFSEDFSAKFVEILEKIYNKPGVDKMLWEDIYIKYIDELPMYINKYEKNDILEFDNLEELRSFDKSYIKNTKSTIIENICTVLNCEDKDVVNIKPINNGMTNLSFIFEVKSKKYVYRHPGLNTDEIINRKNELFSQNIAKKLGLDDTFIYMSEKGWKISRYIEGCTELDYMNKQHIKKAMELIKTLHKECIDCEFEFNILDEAKKMLNSIKDLKNYDIHELTKKIYYLFDCTEKNNIKKRLCHIDCYNLNFLVKGNELMLIDWEFSGKADPAIDLGTFICCSPYTYEEAIDVIKLYFGRDITKKEKFHFVAYIAICSYYWFIWALYKESLGDNVGDYVELYHKYVNLYYDIAMKIN